MAILLGINLAVAYWWRQQERRHESTTEQKMEASRLQAARDTNNRIVGYVCHELRNPLHCLETWFPILVRQCRQQGVAASPSHSNSSLELIDLGAFEDVETALGQMKGIVNDILDYRAVRASPHVARKALRLWWSPRSHV